MAALLSSRPPIVHHSSNRISPEKASTLLSTYIASAEKDASLQPDAILTERGPAFPAKDSTTGLVMHNLKRVEAGLRGEHLGEDLSYADHGGQGLPGMQFGRSDKVEVHGAGDTMGQDGWQDMDEYEREQEVTEGEVGQRHTGVGEDGGDVPRLRESLSVHEKEERKRRKKEKRKKEKKDRLDKKASEKEAEVSS